MSYTPNVPQATQTIASTQAPIQANFQFLNDAIGQEHNFDTTDATKTYHKQSSMPNRADPGALPAGTNGMYYVNGGNAKFYDGTKSYILNQFSGFATGSFFINAVQPAVNIYTLPPNVTGYGMLYKAAAPAAMVPFNFFTDGTKCYAFANRVVLNGSSDQFPLSLVNSNTSLNLLATRQSSTWDGTYTFQLWYR